MRGVIHLHIMERNTAKAAGIRFYFTGKPCCRGNYALRRTSSAKCLCQACMEAGIKSDANRLERAAKWRSDNPGRQREHERRWRKLNAEHERKRLREFHQKNPEKQGKYTRSFYAKNSSSVLARKRAYYRANPDKARVYVVRRRAAKLHRTPSWLTDFHLDEISQIYKLAAKMRKEGIDVHVDHIVPLVGESVCGLHVPWNLAIITALENQQKSNKHKP